MQGRRLSRWVVVYLWWMSIELSAYQSLCVCLLLILALLCRWSRVQLARVLVDTEEERQKVLGAAFRLLDEQVVLGADNVHSMGEGFILYLCPLRTPSRGLFRIGQ